jgi:hypothetical protein
MDCVECRKIIDGMFKNLSPSNVDLGEATTREHLLKCLECRRYLEEMYERKKEEVDRKK